jgi:multidrug efflux system membrane fusion protein
MAKGMWILAGIAAVGSAAFAYRDQLGPYTPELLASFITYATGAEEEIKGAGAVKPGEASSAKAPKSAQSPPSNQAPPSKKGAPGASPVTVATSALADMPVILSAPGTVEPLATVAIKPRVDGQVIEVGFKEGDQVTAGDVLYRLDDRLVRAQIKQAEAQISRDEASIKDAMSIAERRESLLLKKYASEASTETARQNVEVLKASIASGQALLEAQRTQLDYLVIRAPITGRTGSITARLGAFVRSADTAPLVTINQTKPIAVAFALPQVALQQVKDAMATNAEAVVTVAGPKPIMAKGLLKFVDNQIDKTTGTVTGKVVVENAEEVLWPGQAVKIDLTVETRRNMVTVPASAVMPAQQGMIVWVLGSDNKVSVRTVVQDRVIGQVAYLASGLNANERVITDGQLRLAPGAPVTIRGEGQGGGGGGGGRPGGASQPAAGGGVGQAPAKAMSGTSGGG